MLRYYAIHKPYHVLSQFTAEGNKKSLADVFDVPKDVYPVGRLDYDSEGLLILTNDTRLNHLLLSPSHQHEREYWVQVEGIITEQALKELQAGITISIDGKQHRTLPCCVSSFIKQPPVNERNPPIRFRKDIPVSWIRLLLTEGKNRQVRRMTAKVGFPTLRLIRYRIEKLTIEGIDPGSIIELPGNVIYRKLCI